MVAQQVWAPESLLLNELIVALLNSSNRSHSILVVQLNVNSSGPLDNSTATDQSNIRSKGGMGLVMLL